MAKVKFKRGTNVSYDSPPVKEDGSILIDTDSGEMYVDVDNTRVKVTDTSKQNTIDAHNIPSGGTTGQVLKKKTGTNYDVEWQDDTVGAVNSVNSKTGDVFLNAFDVSAVPQVTGEFLYNNGEDLPRELEGKIMQCISNYSTLYKEGYFYQIEDSGRLRTQIDVQPHQPIPVPESIQKTGEWFIENPNEDGQYFDKIYQCASSSGNYVQGYWYIGIRNGWQQINIQPIPTQLSELTEDATHRVVTDTEKTTWNNKTFSPIDEVIWQKPVNFGIAVNNKASNNIKLYRDISNEIFVFLGSGEMYVGGFQEAQNGYTHQCGLGCDNRITKKVYIQEGITSIGSSIFNRWTRLKGYVNSSIVDIPDVKTFSGDNMVDRGYTTNTLVLPKSLNYIHDRAFTFNRSFVKITILCDSNLSLDERLSETGNHNRIFAGSIFETIEIPNATSLVGYHVDTFNSLPYLKNFSINCLFSTSIGFSQSKNLSQNSLINIANHLDSTATGQTLTLHADSKTLCQSINGNVTAGEFVYNASGTTTLTDFITNTKGWTIA